jgi:hypothetical protein
VSQSGRSEADLFRRIALVDRGLLDQLADAYRSPFQAIRAAGAGGGSSCGKTGGDGRRPSLNRRVVSGASSTGATRVR